MKNSALMNFVVNKENRKINVEREFAAPLDMVWTAWTQAELLDRWWAPSPWTARTKSMNFNEGGHWLYAMVGPEGEEHWARVDYQTITPRRSFSAIDSFCDADGIANDEMPRNHWETRFNELSESTRVDIELTFDNLDDLETIIEMGFREGFTAGLENLDSLLAEQIAAGRQS